jgi:hypothetical protein
VRHAQEEPGAHDAGDGPQAGVEARRIGDGIDAAIEDVIAVVREERRGAHPAQHGREARLGQAGTAEADGERHHLDGQLPPTPERFHQLFAPHQDDEAPRRGGDHLLTQERAAVPLDHVQMRVDLVRAVDREIDRGPAVEGDQRDAQLARERRGSLRGGDAGDAETGLRRAPERMDERRRGPAGTEPDGLAGTYQAQFERARRGR